MPLPFTPLSARAPLHDHHRARFSRLAHSEITFGPTGRVVATLLVLALPVLLLLVSPVFIIFDAGYLVLLVMGLRDIWQPVMTRARHRTETHTGDERRPWSTSDNHGVGT